MVNSMAHGPSHMDLLPFHVPSPDGKENESGFVLTPSSLFGDNISVLTKVHKCRIDTKSACV